MSGSQIKLSRRGKLQVPKDPIIPFIEGDGIGPDIWASAKKVFDAAVEKAYNGDRKIHWKEVYAGEKANARKAGDWFCLLYTSPSPRDRTRSRMPSSA